MAFGACGPRHRPRHCVGPTPCRAVSAGAVACASCRQRSSRSHSLTGVASCARWHGSRASSNRSASRAAHRFAPLETVRSVLAADMRIAYRSALSRLTDSVERGRPAAIHLGQVDWCRPRKTGSGLDSRLEAGGAISGTPVSDARRRGVPLATPPASRRAARDDFLMQTLGLSGRLGAEHDR